MVNDEFVDLDDIVPGTGFRKKSDDMPVKKEIKPKVQESAPENQGTPAESRQPKPEKQDAQKIVDSSDEEIEEETVELEKETKTDAPKAAPIEKKIKEDKPLKSEIKSEIKYIKPQLVREVKEEPAKKPAHKVHKPEIKHKEKVQDKKQPEKEVPKKSIVMDNKKNKSAKDARESKKEKKAAQIKQKKSLSKKPEGKETNWTLVALIILGAIVVAIIIYMALKFDFSGSNNDSVVAVVNGQPIYKSEIANRYNLLINTMSPAIPEEQVLNLTITDKLLLQEAEKRGIRTSDSEVNTLLNEIMTQNNIDEASLKADLASKNVSYDFLFNLYKNTLTINKFINETFSNTTLSDEELRAFYDENNASLKVPDMVQVRHILFMYANETENATYARAAEVLEMIKPDKSNFCDLVVQYTADSGSKDTCGEYNFSADYPFVPEFIDAGFSMTPGEIRIVKTQIGYHIMYKVANIPGYLPSFDEVKGDLAPVLMEQKTVQELQALIANLQSNAIIEIYNDNISTKRFKELNSDNKTPVIAEQIAASQDPIAVQEDASAEAKELVEEAPAEESKEIVVKEVVNTPSSQKYLLAKCLADKGDRVFVASWSPDSQPQLDLFGEYAANLVVIECDPDSNAANLDLAECAKVLVKQYPTWPTWQIDGKLYEGIQSLAALSKESGCPY